MGWIKNFGKSIKDLFSTLANPAEDGNSEVAQADLDAFMSANGAGDYKNTLKAVVDGLQTSKTSQITTQNERKGSQQTEVQSEKQRRK